VLFRSVSPICGSDSSPILDEKMMNCFENLRYRNSSMASLGWEEVKVTVVKEEVEERLL
jgi:hypothetical protein